MGKKLQDANKVEGVWNPDLGNGNYQNPIIHADYSDPDVIRVGEDFFMVASSFNMSPCLPVLHSKDLINWEIINHVSRTFPYPRYEMPQHGDGVWAPSIRYHDGYYWVFFGAPDEGIFMSKTKDPFGEWTPFHLVKQVKGWIDPCPFWDEDGNAYLVHAFAKSRIGFKSMLQMIKMKADGTELIGEGTIVFDGSINHPTIEGPKMHKRNGYYYIFAPAGGVATGWQTVLRSEDIFGPYEDKIVLAQGDTDINGPHQGAWVELENEESWFIHFQDKEAYGRIVHLQPMGWKDDWPWMGNDLHFKGIGEPVKRWKKPSAGKSNSPRVPQTSDEFNKAELGLQWQWKANWKDEWFSLKARQGWLRLYPAKKEAFIQHQPNVLTQKLPAEKINVTIKFDFNAASHEEAFGFLICGEKYEGLLMTKKHEGYSLSFLTDEKQEDGILVKEGSGYFRIEVKDRAVCRFAFSSNGIDFTWIKSEVKALPGRWVGAQIGMLCVSEKESDGHVDIDWIRFEPLHSTKREEILDEKII
ncbi:MULTISPECIES: glycoside hydrolase 43 family protein [unclassified Sutcliffiella]|uniref:glycoside hydrolase family 43 protein n=1 Tax=unclassified Sutcliffiella TaxID=2837532 RepID=UPI0030D144C4